MGRGGMPYWITQHDSTRYFSQLPSSNHWGIPDVKPATFIPERLLPYNRKHLVVKPGDAWHFFLDDYRFDYVWGRYDRALMRLSRTMACTGPDFSIWADAPKAVQIWNVYRSRWLSAYWAEAEIAVIPCVGWGLPDTYDYCFAGVAQHSVVAVSTLGLYKEMQMQDANQMHLWSANTTMNYLDGFKAMVDVLKPSKVLVHGKMLPELEGLCDYKQYTSSWLVEDLDPGATYTINRENV